MSPGTRYFLSCYLSRPDDPDVFCVRHDQSVALWVCRNGSVELLRLWELERISGQKHHYWPLFTVDRATRLVADLLAEEGLTWEDIEGVWGTPGLPRYREITPPPGSRDFPMHSLAHLFSGLLMDTRIFRTETIVALAVDGGPDYVQDSEPKPYWYAGCVARAGRLTFSAVESPAPLYTASKHLFDREDGTLMALASACDAVVDFDLETATKTLTLYGGKDHPSSSATLFVASIADAAREQLHGDRLDHRFSQEDNVRSAVMKCVQRACELIAERNIQRLCDEAGVTPGDSYLSMTGGFALNCPANSHLLNTFGFKGLLTPPCPNDSGQSLGLGLLGLYTDRLLDGSDFVLDRAYFGTAHLELQQAKEEFAAWIVSTSAFDPAVFVTDVAAAPIVWVDGAAEIGPRALGHRSLLADPRTQASKDALNELKQRQWWRPVAPIVLAEHAAGWFELTRPSPFMLETAQVNVPHAAKVPAIVHLDGSARVQTVTAEADPDLHAALSAFHRATGVPLLCNTSLNDKGEPIVNNATEALNFCVRKGVRIAYVGGVRLELSDAAKVDATRPEGPRERRRAYFTGQEGDRDRLWSVWQDTGLSDMALYLLTARTPQHRPATQTERSIRSVNVLAELTSRSHPRFASAADRFRRNLGPGSSFDPGAYWEAE
jgi:carbamoyltransferase